MSIVKVNVCYDLWVNEAAGQFFLRWFKNMANLKFRKKIFPPLSLESRRTEAIMFPSTQLALFFFFFFPGYILNSAKLPKRF